MSSSTATLDARLKRRPRGRPADPMEPKTPAGLRPLALPDTRPLVLHDDAVETSRLLAALAHNAASGATRRGHVDVGTDEE